MKKLVIFLLAILALSNAALAVDYHLDYGNSDPVGEFQKSRNAAINQRAQQIQNEANQLAITQKKMSMASDFMSGANSKNWSQKRQTAISAGIDSYMIPENYDPEFITNINGRH